MDTKVLSAGIRYTNLPEGYVRPESERPNLSEVSEWENVPVIDLACDDRSVIVQQVADACKNYGFFQVINHEVPLETVERVLEVAKEFFNLPVEEKLKLYSDDPSKTMRLSTSFNINKEKVHNWRDYLRLHCYPLDKYVPEWPSDPSTFKTNNDMMYSYLPDHTLDISESEIMCSLVHKAVKRWGSVPIRGFNQETITSKLKTDYSQVLYGLAKMLIKKSKKLELLPAKHQSDVGSTIQESGDDDHLTQVHPQCRDSIATVGNLAKLPDKYGPGVGSTAFRSQPSGGEQSSPGGSGEDHIIEGRYQGHESSASAGSSDLASPALNNTPSASDQSVGASALPEDRDDDEQPPPDRSLFDMEPGVAPPAERRLNPSSVAQICLPVSCGRKHKTSGVMTVMGCVATICGFLSILGTRFPEKAMLWLTAVLWGLPIAASPFALKELV
ncbi:hypothetical protein CUMW_268010 [Citrus unshiu]|uniref:Non-haem dioxygenase N-terminal domain-containing protein n=1 Tax=Citrus unshiu TaxID=55188 RepID=A0A2H5QWD1_CITUN|nr:hypothetical protein CUMW_268010 [Citrus unshiu]